MLKKRIIPCLDVKDGRVVKGVSFSGLVDAGDPIQIAERYDQEGADELAFLDISASTEGRSPLLRIINSVAEKVFIPLTVGGGIRSVNDVRCVLKAGADKVSVNTAALERPELIKEISSQFGSQCLICAIDAKNIAPERWTVFSHGGSKDTGRDALVWAKLVESFGAGEILLTSIDQDGRGGGFDCALTRVISEAVGIPVIASGGVGSLEHFVEGFILGKADAVLAASIFHFGRFSIFEAKQALSQAGIPIRLETK